MISLDKIHITIPEGSFIDCEIKYCKWINMKTESDYNEMDDFLSDDEDNKVPPELTNVPIEGELILSTKNRVAKITRDGVVDELDDIKDLESSVIITDDMSQLYSTFYRKPHRFIFAQVSLSTIQYDLIGLLLSRIHQEHWFANGELRVGYSPTYQFSNTVISDYLSFNRHHLYTLLKEPIVNLKNKNIGFIDEESEKIRFMPLFKLVDYENGILTLIPNDILATDWLSLAGGYAQVNQETFTKLRRGHSKHLYELLSRFKNKGKLRPQSLKSLKAQFGLLDETGEIRLKSYELTKTFMRKCINESIEEINDVEKSIIFHKCPKNNTYGYTTIKRSRKIVAIEFLYSWVTPSNALESGLDSLVKREKRAPYTDPIGVYSIIDNYEFETDHPRNPTLDELSMMISRPEELIANGMELNKEFMIKYSICMAEASRKNLKD